LILASALDNTENGESPPKNSDESLVIIGIIVVGSIAAAIFFLKGYKKNP